MNSNISGFPEFLPGEQIAFNQSIAVIKQCFETYGFTPLDTAAVERISTLVSKGNDNEIYGLFRLADSNFKKDIGLRFDLTVPLARYVSQYSNELVFPYRRYHIAPVWRGERAQAGRYRQFYQCDIDIINEQHLSLEHDAEILFVMFHTLSMLNLPAFVIKVNNRKILSGFLSAIVEDSNVVNMIKLIDKIDKISADEFERSAIDLLKNPADFARLEEFLALDDKLTNEELLKSLLSYSNLNHEFETGVNELSSIYQMISASSDYKNLIKLSMKLARGLNYYTGTVCEVILKDYPSVGSIGGGGRYENLTEMMSSRKFPGVGATIGISRIFPFLIDQKLIDVSKTSTADVLVSVQNRESLGEYIKIANDLRSSGVKTEIYLEDKALKTQLAYADKKGIRFVVIANEEELQSKTVLVKNMQTKDQQLVDVFALHDHLLNIL